MMEKKRGMVLAVVLCFSMMFFAGSASAAEQSVNGGFAMLPGLFDTEATVFFVEYERVMGDKLTIFGRVGALDYEFNDGWYAEEGDGPGFDVGLRYYLTDKVLSALYIGGSLGLWTTDWTYADSSWAGTQWFMGKGDSTAVKIEFEVGYRFQIPNTPVSVIPTFRTGTYLSIDDSCTTLNGWPCANESEIGIYGVAGVSAGFAF